MKVCMANSQRSAWQLEVDLMNFVGQSWVNHPGLHDGMSKSLQGYDLRHLDSASAPLASIKVLFIPDALHRKSKLGSDRKLLAPLPFLFCCIFLPFFGVLK